MRRNYFCVIKLRNPSLHVCISSWDSNLVDEQPQREITFSFLSMEGMKAYYNLEKKGEIELICLKAEERW